MIDAVFDNNVLNTLLFDNFLIKPCNIIKNTKKGPRRVLIQVADKKKAQN